MFIFKLIRKFIVVILGAIIIGGSLYYVVSDRAVVPARVDRTDLETQTLTDGAVTYVVTPKNLVTTAITWDFDISLDTHAGSLDQDLVDIARLVDDKGDEYKATTWEGSPAGGHHREGILKFLPVSPRPAFIELKIQTFSLRWNI